MELHGPRKLHDDPSHICTSGLTQGACVTGIVSPVYHTVIANTLYLIQRFDNFYSE